MNEWSERQQGQVFTFTFNIWHDDFPMNSMLLSPRTLEELETQLLQSIDRLDRGQGVDGEEVFRRLRKRLKESRSNA